MSLSRQNLNDAMADRYSAQVKFPYTSLLDTGGKTLKIWEGFPILLRKISLYQPDLNQWPYPGSRKTTPQKYHFCIR